MVALQHRSSRTLAVAVVGPGTTLGLDLDDTGPELGLDLDLVRSRYRFAARVLRGNRARLGARCFGLLSWSASCALP